MQISCSLFNPFVNHSFFPNNEIAAVRRLTSKETNHCQPDQKTLILQSVDQIMTHP